MDVNIVNEHMALFFHDIMKDQAIYKIMKSAQQSLDEDKSTLQEYKIFKQIIMVYKKIYAYCKQCYKVALIKQKFEDTNNIGKLGEKYKRNRNYCNSKNCKKCMARMQQENLHKQKMEEDKGNSTGNQNTFQTDLKAQPITRSNAMAEEILEDDEGEDGDDMMDDEEEESSEDEIEFKGQYNFYQIKIILYHKIFLSLNTLKTNSLTELKKEIFILVNIKLITYSMPCLI